MTATLTPPRTAAPNLTLWRIALVMAFFNTGIGVATWVTRTPAIRDALGASIAEMGLVIAGLSVGSIIGITVGGPLVSRFGARLVVVAGMGSIALGLAVMAGGVALGQGLAVSAGLALFGYGMGSGEIGNNVSGVALEIAVGRSVVPGLHGAFSLGTVVGALAGILANQGALPVSAHLMIVTTVIAAQTVWMSRHVPALTGRVRRRPEGAAGGDPDGGHPLADKPLAWLDRRLIGLAIIILGMALAEGSASDWLPLIVVDGFGSTAVLGSVIYAAFGTAMAIGRLGGGPVIDRFGRAPVMRASALVAATGIGIVVLAPTLALGAVGVLLWGMGASLGFPVALSAAGDDPRHAARRASFVATAGYAAFLVGPPALGFLGESVGIRNAMVVILVAVLSTVLVAGSVRHRPATQEEHLPPR
ncbi:MFS transporter [Tessaracoccus sp. G1721]